MVNPNDKDRFLEELREIPIVSVVCKRVAISKASIYRWINEDKDFREKFDEALSLGRESITDLAEGQLISLIKRSSLPAIKMWLESNENRYYRPKKAKDTENPFVPIKTIYIGSLEDTMRLRNTKNPSDLINEDISPED